MATDALERQLCVLVGEFFGVDANEVLKDSTFTTDLGADSLDAVEVVMLVEEEFKIDIDEVEAEAIATFGELVALVRTKVKLPTKS